MFECAYIIVHIEVVGHAAAEYCRIAGLFFQCCFVGSSGNVDGEHKCFVDFEIVAFGEFVILHVVTTKELSSSTGLANTMSCALMLIAPKKTEAAKSVDFFMIVKLKIKG